MSSLERIKSAESNRNAADAAAAAPTFRSCRVSPLPRMRYFSSGQSDGSAGLPSPQLASSRGKERPLPSLILLSDIRSDPEEKSSANDLVYERKWKVSEEWRCLPRVPHLYVLGATRTIIMEGSGGTNSPMEVARRIGDCLRALSLDVTYDHRRAKAFATSFDGVEFFVRLFQHPASTEKRGIIVEIQRKRGSALRFHWLSRAVIHCARGEETTETEAGAEVTKVMKGHGDPPRQVGSSSRVSPPASFSRQFPRTQLNAPPMVVAAEDPEYEIEAALETADDLLRKDRTDARELGMESLALLTNEESSGTEKALGVARVLIRLEGGSNNGGEEERSASIRREIFGAIINLREGDNEEEMDCFERRHRTAMRRLAVMALGNSLSILSRTSPDTLTDLDGLDGVLPALMQDVERAEESPHDAALAVRCLSALLGSGSASTIMCKAADDNMRKKLVKARGIGRCRHSMLERESERALLKLV